MRFSSMPTGRCTDMSQGRAWQVAAALGHAQVGMGHVRSPDPFMLARLNVGELDAFDRLRSDLEIIRSEAAARLLQLYRGYVGATVNGVSPLLLRWCDLNREDLDEVAWSLGPNRPWMPWLCGPRPLGTMPGSKSWYPPTGMTAGERAYAALQRFAFSGTVLERRSRRDLFGMRVRHGCLEVGAVLSGTRLRTYGSAGEIVVPGELPSTLVSALPGRTLDQLVQHPLLDGAGCIVFEVGEPQGTGTRILFRLPPVPWRLPWARVA